MNKFPFHYSLCMHTIYNNLSKLLLMEDNLNVIRSTSRIYVAAIKWFYPLPSEENHQNSANCSV